MTEIIPLTTSPTPVKLRVEDYLALDQLGAFDAYGKTELIEGEVVYMNAQHRPHARIKTKLLILIAHALTGRDDGLEPLVEGSVAMPPHDVPEPDISITAEPEGDGLIPLASLALVVEIADTTLRHDLGRKQRIYARAGIPEYWVVDVNARVIHQLWAPAGEAYAERSEIVFGDPIDAATLAGFRIVTCDL